MVSIIPGFVARLRGILLLSCVCTVVSAKNKTNTGCKGVWLIRPGEKCTTVFIYLTRARGH